MPKPKKKDFPVGTPITTPINTPDRASPPSNSFLALQTESDAEEDKSVTNINAEDSQIEFESETEEQPTQESPPAEATPAQIKQNIQPMPTPDDLKVSTSSSGPIAEILPTDLERLKESIPIFASKFGKSVSELFPDPVEHSKPLDEVQDDSPPTSPPRKKPPPVASLPSQPQSSSPPPIRPDKYANSRDHRQ
jgi:hypothetical protein